MVKENVIADILEQYYMAFPIIIDKLIKVVRLLEVKIDRENCTEIARLIKQINEFIRDTKVACRKIQLVDGQYERKEAVQFCNHLRFTKMDELYKIIKESPYLESEDDD